MATLQAIENREKGAVDLSIGTAIAVQAAVGLSEEGNFVQEPPIKRHQELLINLRTLFRNLYGLLDRQERLTVNPDEIVLALMSEMKVIEGLVEQYTRGRTKVSYYACDYNDMTRIFPKAYFKEVKTDLQKTYAAVENGFLRELAKRLNDQGEEPFREYRTRLNGKGRRTMIITHYPIDLLWAKTFDSLELLESHTGDIKKKVRWNTKLTNGNKDEMKRIPFNQMTLQLFGDGGGLLSPYPKKYRDHLKAVAEKYKWDTLTSRSRILLTVKNYRNAALEKLVNELFR